MAAATTASPPERPEGSQPPCSEVVPAAADRVPGHPEQGQGGADYHDDDADCPDDRDFRDEPDNEEDNEFPGRLAGFSLGLSRWLPVALPAFFLLLPCPWPSCPDP
jgi:hypothetical protein